MLSLFAMHIAQAQTEETKFSGYLFAYFEGRGKAERQEQLRFAVSADGVNWSALNDNRPIIPASEMSLTGGIRDPHILRGADGKGFYLVATDMFTMRDGWESNPGIVLLKSDNLTDWSPAVIDLPKRYPKKFGNVKWAWAPQTIYDPEAGKYLVYFTLRFHGDERLDFYCAYANADFTAFEREPELLFSPKFGGIDGDIVHRDGLYHFFFKGNTKDAAGREFRNGIQRATAKSLKGPWTEDFKYLDAYADTSVVVEGSSVFKRNDAEEYILMYDRYADGRYEFQRSTDLFQQGLPSAAWQRHRHQP